VTWLKILVVLSLVLVIYSPTLRDLGLDWWTDSSLSQGLLILPLALYIAWLRRGLTLDQPPAPTYCGFLAIAAAAVCFLLGKLGAEFFLTRMSFVILLFGLIWTFWGWPRLRTLFFPFALLATSIPLPALIYNTITAPLQLFASAVATEVAQFFGISVYRDGNIIHLAQTSLGVEEACSGLNSLSALMIASLLLGFLQLARPWLRVLIFLLAVPLAIGVNIFRIAGTAVIADYQAEFAQGFYHLFSGWLVFVMGFGALYLICSGMHRWLDQKS
jgi:exosortase